MWVSIMLLDLLAFCRWNFALDGSIPCNIGLQPEAVDDFFVYNRSLSCSTDLPIANMSVTQNDLNTTPTEVTLIVAPAGGGTATKVDGSLEDTFTYQRSSCSGTWQGYDSFVYGICTNAFVPKSDNATVWVVANPGPTSAPATIDIGSQRSITFSATGYWTQTVFALNWTTLAGDTSNSQGSITYDTTAKTITFTLFASSTPASSNFTYTLCDDPQAAGLPAAVPRMCTTGLVVLTAPLDTDGDTVPDALDIDMDNDGILNTAESPGLADPIGDLDNDGILNAWDSSYAQCGGMVLGYCTAYDMDGDGIPNFLDLDSDGDTIPDLVEALSSAFLFDGNGSGMTLGTLDSNFNGIVNGGTFGANGFDNRLETSVDSGIPRAILFNSTTYVDTDHDGRIDSLDLDSDGDGVYDLWESRGYTSYPTALDANLNGVVDVLNDTDRDGIQNSYDNSPTIGGSSSSTLRPTNANPALAGSAVDRDGDHIPDFRDLDSDNDGVLDILESGILLSATVLLSSKDTDSNGVVDDLLSDADADGISDSVDLVSGLGSAYPSAATSGAYALTRDFDVDAIADMYDVDSDNDGISDLDESGNTAASSTDTNNDGVLAIADADGDGISDAADRSSSSYGSASMPSPRNSLSSALPDMINCYSHSASNSDLLLSGRSVAQYDTDNNGVLDATADTDFDGIVEPTSPLVVDSLLGIFGGLAILGPVGPTSTITFNIANFRPLEIDAYAYVTAGEYPLKSPVTSTNPTVGSGSVLVNGHNVTYTSPITDTPPTASFVITVCDQSPIVLCATINVQVQPYVLRWVTPTASTVWNMYLQQVRTSHLISLSLSLSLKTPRSLGRLSALLTTLVFLYSRWFGTRLYHHRSRSACRLPPKLVILFPSLHRNLCLWVVPMLGHR
jgi:hypothetical protein